MQVRMVRNSVTPLRKGKIYDLPEPDGQRLIRLSAAVPAEEGKQVDAAHPEGPEQQPPVSGPGSGVDAWRRYAAAVTDTSESELAGMSRDQLIELVSD